MTSSSRKETKAQTIGGDGSACAANRKIGIAGQRLTLLLGRRCVRRDAGSTKAHLRSSTLGDAATARRQRAKGCWRSLLGAL